MAESQNDAYVRRDVFEARMDRMEMLLEKTVLEIKSYVDKSTGETRIYVEKAIGGLRDEVKSEISSLRDEVKSEISGLRAEVQRNGSDIRVLTARVDSLENVFYWGLSGFGIILASAVILPAIIGFLKKVFQPSVTIEEIQRLIDTAITTRLSGGESK